MSESAQGGRTMRHGLMWVAMLLLCLGGAAAAELPAGGSTGPGGRVGQQGYLGIGVRDVTEDDVTSLHLKEARGAVIVRVDHDAPAGKMGLRERDVVLQMNGAAVDGEESLTRMLHETTPGRTVTLLISRDGSPITMTALISDRDQVARDAWTQHLAAASTGLPGPQAPATGLPTGDLAQSSGGAAGSGADSSSGRYSRSFLGTLLLSPSYTGAILEKMGPQLSGFFGVGDGSGLLVRSVEPDSPAARAGMRAGDVVTHANLMPVMTMSDWAKAIKEAKGRPVTVTLMRDKAVKMVTLTPDGKKRSELVTPDDSDGNQVGSYRNPGE